MHKTQYLLPSKTKIQQNFAYCINGTLHTNMEKNYNRLKVVLAEKKKTNKWLAEKLGKDPATVSKWCTNIAQPGIETLYLIAECLEIDVRELLTPTREENIVIYRK